MQSFLFKIFPRRKDFRLRGLVLTVAFFVIAPGTMSGTAFVVSNNQDSGAGSFRQALIQANATAGTDTITFQGVSGLIYLGSALPDISDALNIQGPGPRTLSLHGSNVFRVLTIGPAGTVQISGLGIVGGMATNIGGGRHFKSGESLPDQLFGAGKFQPGFRRRRNFQSGDDQCRRVRDFDQHCLRNI